MRTIDHSASRVYCLEFSLLDRHRFLDSRPAPSLDSHGDTAGEVDPFGVYVSRLPPQTRPAARRDHVRREARLAHRCGKGRRSLRPPCNLRRQRVRSASTALARENQSVYGRRLAALLALAVYLSVCVCTESTPANLRCASETTGVGMATK